MKILLTNDDGIHAGGLKEFKKSLENYGKVVLIAPDRERSGAGHSTSIYQTVSCREIWYGKDFFGYALSGTPVDCVIVGLEKLFGDDRPDLVISGINAGINLGRDIFYSGTIGAAIEGAFHDILSIAISIDKKGNTFYSSAIKVMEKIIKTLPTEAYRQPQALNINVPNIRYSEVKGFRLTKLAHVFHQKIIDRICRSGSTDYFWIEGSQTKGAMEKNSDYWAICNHFISITALSLELQDNNSLNNLRKWIQGID